MTYYDVWIEFAGDGPARIPSEGGSRRIGPLFPDGRDAFFAVKHRLDRGSLTAWQIDWGS